MSKIDELIKEKCPNGVEYRTLGKVCLVGAKDAITKSMLSEDGPYPVINSSREILGYLDRYNNTGNTLVLTSHGAYAGFCHFMETEFFAGALCYPMKSVDDNIILTKYIYYWLKNIEGTIRETYTNKSGVPYINFKALMKSKIPVPPLEIQQEIVGMLNSFTELEAELEAELTKRKQQYEHYRNSLLENSDGGNVQWLALGDVCKLVTGATPSRTNHSYWDGGTIPWMNSGEVNLRRVFKTEEKITEDGYNHASTTIVPKHSIVMALAGQGKTRGKVAITEIELCTNQSLCSIICGEKINYKYLFHYLDSKYENLRSISNGDGTRGGLSLRILSPYKIPVPKLDMQEKIVYVLDNFDAVCNDLNIGLPAEIEARQRQYEYYRDRLLSFDAVIGDGIERERGVAKLHQYIFGFAEVQLKLVACYSRERISSSNLDGETFVGVDNLLQGKLGKIVSAHLPENGNWTKYTSGDILIGNIRPYLRKIWFANNSGGASGDVLVIKNDFEQLDSRYLYHVLASESFFEYDNGKSKGSKMPRGDKTTIMEYGFTIPTMDKQQKIVAILDEFDKLTSDMTAGLPAEIEARHKQYEYYRDKLLSFKEI